MTRFFRDREDTSSRTITEAASFLNRKPKRQGGNYTIEESALDIFDDKFKKHPNHLNLITRKNYNDMTPEEKDYHDEYKKRKVEADKERKARVERPNPVKHGPAFGPKDNWGG